MHQYDLATNGKHPIASLVLLICVIALSLQHSRAISFEVSESTELLQHRVHLSSGVIPPEVSRHDAKEKQVQEVQEALSNLDMDSKKMLWWNLTKDLDKNHGLPIHTGPGQTTLRRTLNLWTQQVGTTLATEQMKHLQCAETGDGHFLRGMFAKICSAFLVFDKYDPAADVQLDLNVPPASAAGSVKAAHSTVDVLVSNQVFEHLLRPSVGMANLNALLKLGGKLIFSTPFVVQDHRAPATDYFRYTVMGIRQLLQCAGFSVLELRGLGNRLESIAYLAGATSDMLDLHDLTRGCEGNTSNDCANQFYSGVAAVGLKTESKTLDEIHACFG